MPEAVAPDSTPRLRELRVDDLDWDLRPMATLPPMTPDDMILETLLDALAYRLLAREALEQLHQLTVQAARHRKEIAELRARLRGAVS